MQNIRKKKRKATSNKPCPAANEPDYDQRYQPRPLRAAADFDLEREAIQRIVDGALQLQAYIAMRER